jgi:DNA-directed RNA polymerase specialized sigma24 family protein
MALQFSLCRADVEDCVSEAVVRLLEENDWDDPLAVAQRAMNQYSRTKSSALFPVGVGTGERDVDSQMPDWLSRTQTDELEQVLRTFNGLGLTEDERLTAVKYFVEKKGQADVADELGVSPATVFRRLARVRDAVREQWLDN